jgi:nicotinamidase/pyrazinamidase
MNSFSLVSSHSRRRFTGPRQFERIRPSGAPREVRSKLSGIKVALMMPLVIGAALTLAACEPQEMTKPTGDATALVLCDLQRSFLEPSGAMPVAQDEVEPLINAVNASVDAAHNQVVPVIYIRDEYSPFQFIGNFSRDYAALRYEAGSAFDPRVNSTAGVSFTKQSPDAFSNDAFESYLETIGIGRLVMAGVFADRCVLETAKSASARGYKVTIISDAVASSSNAARDDALRQLKDSGVQVESSKEFIASLDGEKSEK